MQSEGAAFGGLLLQHARDMHWFGWLQIIYSERLTRLHLLRAHQLPHYQLSEMSFSLLSEDRRVACMHQEAVDRINSITLWHLASRELFAEHLIGLKELESSRIDVQQAYLRKTLVQLLVQGGSALHLVDLLRDETNHRESVYASQAGSWGMLASEAISEQHWLERLLLSHMERICRAKVIAHSSSFQRRAENPFAGPEHRGRQAVWQDEVAAFAALAQNCIMEAHWLGCLHTQHLEIVERSRIRAVQRAEIAALCDCIV
eukprot:NODE_2055_length_1310_cov_51.220460_g1869_i0.p1 GENE.NODE_2055_length_1310_cov_51.220460_g1869_i0~~NODE_2055_length_1310_cov_51.220460_g1869_i0.p1  ORF type:complete len:260 (+),score=39.50 NODE_2055_length_1310_cov_51.220460_g1869_i0:475-1254(+)